VSLDGASLLGGDGSAALGRLRAQLAIGDCLEPGKRQVLILTIAVRPVFRGGRTWMVRSRGVAEQASAMPDKSLLKALAQAHQSLAAHSAAPTQSPAQWRQASSIVDSYVRRLTGAAFLAPDIQRAIAEGRQPAGLSALQMINSGIPLAWADQRRAFGFAPLADDLIP
jgi:site-specific DNA recombinase